MISNDTGIPIRRHSLFRWVVTISLAAMLIGFGVYRYKMAKQKYFTGTVYITLGMITAFSSNKR